MRSGEPVLSFPSSCWPRTRARRAERASRRRRRQAKAALEKSPRHGEYVDMKSRRAACRCGADRLPGAQGQGARGHRHPRDLRPERLDARRRRPARAPTGSSRSRRTCSRARARTAAAPSRSPAATTSASSSAGSRPDEVDARGSTPCASCGTKLPAAQRQDARRSASAGAAAHSFAYAVAQPELERRGRLLRHVAGAARRSRRSRRRCWASTAPTTPASTPRSSRPRREMKKRGQVLRRAHLRRRRPRLPAPAGRPGRREPEGGAAGVAADGRIPARPAPVTAVKKKGPGRPGPPARIASRGVSGADARSDRSGSGAAGVRKGGCSNSRSRIEMSLCRPRNPKRSRSRRSAPTASAASQINGLTPSLSRADSSAPAAAAVSSAGAGEAARRAERLPERDLCAAGHARGASAGSRRGRIRRSDRSCRNQRGLFLGGRRGLLGLLGWLLRLRLGLHGRGSRFGEQAERLSGTAVGSGAGGSSATSVS